MLITALLGSWKKSVPRSHREVLILLMHTKYNGVCCRAVCVGVTCPRRLPSYVVADGASFIVCLVYWLSRLVCDVYFCCGSKHF
jgi:hypothetical protein